MKRLIAFLVIACMTLFLFAGVVVATDETEAASETLAETVADTEAETAAETEAATETQAATEAVSESVAATTAEEEAVEEESKGPGALQIILLVMQIISCVALTVIIVLQSSKESGLGALSGNSGNFLNGKGVATLDAKLASITKWIAAAFVLLTLLVSMLYTVA